MNIQYMDHMGWIRHVHSHPGRKAGARQATESRSDFVKRPGRPDTADDGRWWISQILTLFCFADSKRLDPRMTQVMVMVHL